MNYSIIPLLIILLSLAVIIVIIVRKFPQLSVLDVDSLPEVKEEKKKDEFLKKRAKKRNTGSHKKVMEKLAPLVQSAKEFQLSFRQYVGKVERSIVKEDAKKRETAKPEQKKEMDNELRSLLHDAAHALEQGDLESAEKKYIAAIRIDTKSSEAYRGLGDVYFAQEQFDEALETYGFLLQLEPKNDAVIVKLAELCEKKGEIEQAIEYYQQALLINANLSNRFAKAAELLMQLDQYETAAEAIAEAVDLEPQNPKYLDMLVEISIMGANKDAARDAYERLRMVNPENQKLAAFKDRIGKM